MKFRDDIKVKGERLQIWKIYPDGRKELAYDDAKPKPFFAWKLRRKKKYKWDKS